MRTRRPPRGYVLICWTSCSLAPRETQVDSPATARSTSGCSAVTGFQSPNVANRTAYRGRAIEEQEADPPPCLYRSGSRPIRHPCRRLLPTAAPGRQCRCPLCHGNRHVPTGPAPAEDVPAAATPWNVPSRVDPCSSACEGSGTCCRPRFWPPASLRLRRPPYGPSRLFPMPAARQRWVTDLSWRGSAPAPRGKAGSPPGSVVIVAQLPPGFPWPAMRWPRPRPSARVRRVVPRP